LGQGKPTAVAASIREYLSIVRRRVGHSGTGTVMARSVKRDLFRERTKTSGSHEGKTVSRRSRSQISRTAWMYRSSASEFCSRPSPRRQSLTASGTEYTRSTNRDTAPGASRPRRPCSRYAVTTSREAWGRRSRTRQYAWPFHGLVTRRRIAFAGVPGRMPAIVTVRADASVAR
jgi:hypothetical protein